MFNDLSCANIFKSESHGRVASIPGFATSQRSLSTELAGDAKGRPEPDQSGHSIESQANCDDRG